MDQQTSKRIFIDLILKVIDRPNLLKDVLEELSKFHVNISKASTRLYKNGQAKLFLTCDITRSEEFNHIKQKLLSFEDIIDISRSN